MTARHLRRPTTWLAFVMALALSWPGIAPRALAAAGASDGGVQVRVAQNLETTRIEFAGSLGGRATVKRQGQALVVRIAGKVQPDLTRLRIYPPPFIKGAVSQFAGAATEVTITLTDNADASSGNADGAVYINVFKRKPVEAKSAPDAAALKAAKGQTDKSEDVKSPNDPALVSATTDPRPASGVLPVAASGQPGQASLQFVWNAPVGAAVFRRGDAIWIVFDAKVRLDIARWPKALTAALKPQVLSGVNYSALRVSVPVSQTISVSGAANTWVVDLGATKAGPTSAIFVAVDEASNPPSLAAVVGGATRSLWLDDLVVGDRIAVVTALAPAKGLASRQEYVDMALLKSFQGLGVEPVADDIAVSVVNDQVRIGRPQGLALSTRGSSGKADMASGAPQPATMPGYVDFKIWSKTGSGGFIGRYNALFQAASEETGSEQQAPVGARMALARFLIGSDLAYETIGLLNAVGATNRTSLDDPEFRGLRGAAKTMVGRYAEAANDLAMPELASDPASALWRGYGAAQLGQWADARQALDQGMPALAQFSPLWRARFARAAVQAAMGLGDLKGASERIALALNPKVAPLEWLKTLMIQAELFDRLGDTNRALAMYEAMARSRSDQVRVPALLRATQIKQARGLIQPVDALDTYDRLRFGWRGDSTELKAIAAQAQLYVDLGRFREALTVMGSIGKRLPDKPEARQLASDSSAIFRSLFLDNLADNMQPIQALALFYDFKVLIPIGSEGDVMARRLARRLVDVDLLDEAAALLKYQTENRLEGVDRSMVATDLALVQLMNHQPEKALEAINSSRTTLLPAPLNAERRLIEAKAWSELGRNDHALELLTADKSAEANDIRTDIAWHNKGWAEVGASLEKRLGDRWKTVTNPLSEDEENALLRAAIGYSLAADAKALTRLGERYSALIDKARQAEALRLALDGVDADNGVMPSQALSKVSQNDVFAGWVARAKQKFHAQVLKPSGAAVKPQLVNSAQAAPAKPKA